MMDWVTSVAIRWLGKGGYKGPLSSLEYFAQKSTQLLETRHGVRELERAEGVKEGGVWLYNSRWLMTGHGKDEGIEAKCLHVHPGMFRVPMASKVGMAVMTYCHQLNGHHRGVTAACPGCIFCSGGRSRSYWVNCTLPVCLLHQLSHGWLWT